MAPANGSDYIPHTRQDMWSIMLDPVALRAMFKAVIQEVLDEREVEMKDKPEVEIDPGAEFGWVEPGPRLGWVAVEFICEGDEPEGLVTVYFVDERDGDRNKLLPYRSGASAWLHPNDIMEYEDDSLPERGELTPETHLHPEL